MKIYFHFVIILIFTGLCSLECSNITEPEDTFLYEDSTPAWSPDGDWIAYYHTNDKNIEGYKEGLYIIDPAGQNRQLVKAGPAYSPCWSPDSKKLAFSDGDNIFVIDITGINLQQVTNDTGLIRPNWSPVDNKIVFGKRYYKDSFYILVLDINANSIEYLLPSFCGVPAWDPTGQNLLYINTKYVFFYNTTTNDTTNIADILKYITGTTPVSSIFVDPVMSANGNLIALSPVAINFEKGIWLLDMELNNLLYLADGMFPSFSPDSKKIVFRKFVGGTRFLLYTINVDGTELMELTK